ncbi:hypothetical protein [Helicobacter sp. 13S00401-1]|uniref:hypothetical protein n=1 Tax=Helicobacter sp. 13S00401-1 TaxID=1905758 RepID=UPI00117A66A4|nr:hypothetical protein [Helicobacter sp. 13S00401-1]
MIKKISFIKNVSLASALIISFSTLGYAKVPLRDLHGFGYLAGTGAGLSIDAFKVTQNLSSNIVGTSLQPGTENILGGNFSAKLGVAYFPKQTKLGTFGLEGVLGIGARIMDYTISKVDAGTLLSPKYFLDIKALHLFGNDGVQFGYMLGVGLAYSNYFMFKTKNVNIKNGIKDYNPALNALLSPKNSDTLKGSLSPTISIGLLTVINRTMLSLEYKEYFNSYVGFSSDITLNYAYYFGGYKKTY